MIASPRLPAGLTLCFVLAGAGPLAAQSATGSDIRPSVRIGPLRVDLRAKLQLDFRQAADTTDAVSEFDVTRKRIGVEGTLFRRIEFQIERELQPESPWRDVFVDVRSADGLSVRAGKFKVPFGLDQLTSPTRLDFVHRSRIGAELSPGRDVGVTLHGRFRRRALSYDAGVFAHDGDNSRTSGPANGGATLAGRLTIRPTQLLQRRTLGRPLELGINATLGNVPEGLASPGGQTSLGEQLHNPVYVHGRQLRVGIDAVWNVGALSAKSEFVRVEHERRGQGLIGDDLPPLVAQGWYVSGAWALTGEGASGASEPNRPLFGGGLGAVEIAVRHEHIRTSSVSAGEAPSRSPRAAHLQGTEASLSTFGVTWYLTRWTKVQANLVRERVDDALWLTLVRFQIVL